MDEEYQQYSQYGIKKASKQHNTLPLWGNEASMNLNPLILANIQGSSYFKVHLFKLKTYHEVVDEIYYQVKHLEPWERGSRKTSGQTGMCGGVRGVGAGGIVSTAFCLLYKLYTLRLTRKQVNGLLNHSDSPYIRALGFMYIRYTQPPADLYDWYEDYLQDDEEIDVKAGGGQTITIGQMAFQFLTKLDWFSTLFPRIPVPMQKQIEKKLELYCRENQVNLHQLNARIVGCASSANNSNNGNLSNFSGRGGGGGGNYEDRDYSYNNRNESYREDYNYNKKNTISTTSGNYRSEHDDREKDYHDHRSSSSHHRRRSSPPAVSPSRRGDNNRNMSSNHREKHKKKHKRKDRSRSRERRRRDRYERKEASPSPGSYHREREYDRNKSDYSERKYR